MNLSLKKSKILILSNLNKNNDHRVYKSYFFFKKIFRKVDDRFYKNRKFKINFIFKVIGLLNFAFLIRKLHKKNSYD